MALRSNLSLYWKLDGNSNDSVGANNGTDADITYSAGNGKIVQGAGFNGSSSSIDTFGTGIYDGTNGSAFIWIKIASAPAVSAAPLAFVVHDQGTHSFLYLKYKNDAGTYKVLGGRSRYGVADDEISVTKTLTVGTWYNIGITQSGTTINMYIDGAYAGTVTSSGNGTGSPADQIRLGAWLTGGDWINSALDEFGVWTRNLTELEIKKLYNSGDGLAYPFPGENTSTLLTLNVG